MPEVLADNIFSVELLDMPSTQEITSNSLTLSTNDDPALDFTLIKDHLISIFRLNKQLDSRVVKFAPTYKLVFSLMNQDSRTGDAIVRWDIRNLMKGRCFVRLLGATFIKRPKMAQIELPRSSLPFQPSTISLSIPISNILPLSQFQ
jgi:hypothetical protein